ncbi:hypothetical protein MJO29_015016 [Puccinia striiformis f. sp. tritici]|uniref:Uncharacterized protein n=1 Tax=Puccinia striiformis f. sp. tritici PST-78 TaxID=1165861 RepID=A0A0L0V5E0_9BASI|nr:hypothetical protein MJO29_015016 [Puccinia striiformis f. sp. tritici]KNE94473.1 hypothetical protein PSTG_12196 [Puccinia striiformis f. sp. tritici PST-78]
MKREAIEASLAAQASDVNPLSSSSEHNTNPRKKSSSSSNVPQKKSSSSSTRTSSAATKEYFCVVVTTKRKKPLTKPVPKKKPTPVTPKETKFTPSLNTQLINCGLVLYKGSKPANDPLLFNIKQTVDIKNPDLFEELQHLSLLNGHSRLTDLDSLIYVIHKSTNKKPVQVDLAYQHPTEEKKTRKYVEDDSDSDDDSNIVQIQPKKCFPSRSRPQNIDSASSSRYKRQKIASDSGSSFSNDSELPSIETLSASQMPPSTSANYESHNTRFKSTKIPGIQVASAKPNPRIPVSNVIPNSKAVVHKNSDEWASSGISCKLSTFT